MLNLNPYSPEELNSLKYPQDSDQQKTKDSSHSVREKIEQLANDVIEHMNRIALTRSTRSNQAENKRTFSYENDHLTPPLKEFFFQKAGSPSPDVEDAPENALIDSSKNQEIIEKKDRNFNQIAEAFNRIKADVSSGYPLDNAYFIKKYELELKNEFLSAEEKKNVFEELNAILNIAFCQRLKENRSKLFDGIELEEKLMQGLGFNIDFYQDKENICKKFWEVFAQAISKNNREKLVLPPDKFQAFVGTQALKARFLLADIQDPKQMRKIATFIEKGKELKKNLQTYIQALPLVFPSSFPENVLPLAKQMIEQNYHSLGAHLLDVLISDIMLNQNMTNLVLGTDVTNTLLTTFLSRILDPESEEIIKIVKESYQKMREEILDPQINVYMRWGNDLKQEMIQGLLLDQGVCFSLCCKLLFKYQSNPDLEVAENLAINDLDHYVQAMYQLNNHAITQKAEKFFAEMEEKEIKAKGIKGRDAFAFFSEASTAGESFSRELMWKMPDEVFRKTDFNKIEHLFNLNFDENDIEIDLLKRIQSKKISGQLKESNGWMFCGLLSMGGKHVTLMRFDQERGKVWFFDPNIGLFCFEGNHKKYEEAQKECLYCFRELAAVFYPGLYELEFRQLRSRDLSSKN